MSETREPYSTERSALDDPAEAEDWARDVVTAAINGITGELPDAHDYQLAGEVLRVRLDASRALVERLAALLRDYATAHIRVQSDGTLVVCGCETCLRTRRVLADVVELSRREREQRL